MILSVHEIEQLHHIIRDAGAAIMDMYASDDFGVIQKDDDGYISPLTKADLAAHEIIQAGLEAMTPDIPILSEESKEISYEERKERTTFRCVDPLDGTKEFVKRNGEFTVNIALIHEGYPVAGCIYVPVSDDLYRAVKGEGSWHITKDGTKKPLHVTQVDKNIHLVASRSHTGDDDAAFQQKLADVGYTCSIVSRGSALKFCLIASGQAHVYPRFKPTMERDTAAGQCLVEEAGGCMVPVGSSERFCYNKESLRNPGFIVSCDSVLLEMQ